MCEVIDVFIMNPGSSALAYVVVISEDHLSERTLTVESSVTPYSEALG